MFRIRRVGIDTHSEHVIFIHQRAVQDGRLGFKPLDRVRIEGRRQDDGAEREIGGILNFCHDELVGEDQIGLSEEAFRDLGLPEGSPVRASLSRPPQSVDRVRRALAGERLHRADFDAILADVVQRRYSKVELSMFVLACAMRRLDDRELVDFTRAMVDLGGRLDFGDGTIADKHCIGGIPGNRTTMVVVPILAALGVRIPKTSSRAITSPAGTADTMGVLADVALGQQRMYEVVERTGACIAWGGALDLAPADDILITVERPMAIDTEAQMIASIVSKKRAAGASHALIDIPVGPSAKVHTREEAGSLVERFQHVATELGLTLETVVTDAFAPIGYGVGPRLEALDVLAVLDRDAAAPPDLREKSLYLAARILELVGAVHPHEGYPVARGVLEDGRARRKLAEIVEAQGPRELPPEAPFREVVVSRESGRIRQVDCWEINTLAKLAGAPAHASAGLRVLRKPGDVVAAGEPLLEIHAQSTAQLEIALEHARTPVRIFELGF